jgi:hypothetical protein
MTSKLLIDIPSNWCYTFILAPGQKYTAGRATANHIHLPALGVSMQHAEIAARDNRWAIRDLKSQTGTLVNGKRVADSPLADGDVVRLGAAEMVYQSPAERVQKDEWNRTRGLVAEREHQIREAISHNKSDSVVLDPTHYSSPGMAPAAPVPPGTMGAPAPLGGDDLVWIAQQLAAILSEVLNNPGTRDEAFAFMLRRLRESIGADNGFLMLVDPVRHRWVIRAWVGDGHLWTDYEKEHPVPLTIANQCYQKGKLLSNAVDFDTGEDEPIESKSMEIMQVHCYIAVPLLEGRERRGVLYFDTRRTIKMFSSRELKLIERAGNYILEIERQKV